MIPNTHSFNAKITSTNAYEQNTRNILTRDRNTNDQFEYIHIKKLNILRGTSNRNRNSRSFCYLTEI